jgi:DNA-binding CsgD family transcriptional regulator
VAPDGNALPPSAAAIAAAVRTPDPSSSIDHALVVQNLRLPLTIFAGPRVIYRNKAADRLERWLRDKYSTELVTVLGDHVAQIRAAGKQRETVTLVRLPEGGHLFIDVAPLDGGYRVVSVRAPGLELSIIASHYRLSPRELEVVEQVLRGHSNQTIADSMGVKTETVKKHLTRVFDKVGVDSRTQLMSLLG